MTHLDHIAWGEKPQHSICIPSHKRADCYVFSKLAECEQSATVYIDEDDDLNAYSKWGHNVIVGPSQNIAQKRHSIVTHQLSIGNHFVWFIDDDFYRFHTKDMDNHVKALTISELFATAERFIDYEKDMYVKIPAGNLGWFLFGKNKTYKFKAPSYVSTKTLIAGCYGLNIELMTKYGINFDPHCPHGVGEDVELVCQFIAGKHRGRTITIVQADFNRHVKSQAWDFNTEIKEGAHLSYRGIADTSQKHRDTYIYLKAKYPKLIYWDAKNKLGATTRKQATEYPDWYEPTFKFGSHVGL